MQRRWQVWLVVLALLAGLVIVPVTVAVTAAMVPTAQSGCAAVSVDANGVGVGGAGYTVTSFNIRGAQLSAASAGMSAHKADYAWSKRGPHVVRYLANINADLIGLQEANTAPGGTEQISTIKAGLSGYLWLNTDHATPIGYRASAFTAGDHGRVRLSTLGVLGATSDRWAAWVKLKATSDGSELLFINLHAQHMQIKGPAKARSVGWTKLLNALKSINPGNRLPTIMVGDFNASSNEIRAVFNDHLVKFGAAGFVDAASVATTIAPITNVNSFNGFGDTIAGHWYYKSINRGTYSSNHIDYVWTQGKARATTWQIYTGPGATWKTIKGRQVPFADFIPSDHWPVIAKVIVGADPTTTTSSSTSGNPQLALQQAAGSSGGFGLPQWGSPRHQSLTSPIITIPAPIRQLYQAAAARYGIGWQLLAGIGMAETRHGANNNTSSAGAQGLMQFMPATFASFGVDGDGDGRTDIHSDADSIFSAANYLVASGAKKGAKGVLDALWAYNHSESYRNDVLYYAWAYLRTSGVVGDGALDAGCSGMSSMLLSVAASGQWADVIDFALSKVGVYPYSWGGGALDGPTRGTASGANIVGFDCSSFVRFSIYQTTRIVIPRDSRSQAAYFQARGVITRTNNWRELQAGDVVFFSHGNSLGSIYHVALVTKPGWIVEEPGRGRFVQHNPMQRRMPGDIWGYARVDLTSLKGKGN